MGRFTFVIGGTRSGKSDFALHLAEKTGQRRVFCATARATDPEMEIRIQRHKSSRGSSWETREEPLNPASALGDLPLSTEVVVIDCITVLLSNLMLERTYDDAELVSEMETLASVICEGPFPVIAVSNEVGMGLVPAEPLGRRFRDLAGLVNQRLAAAADEVFLVAAGIPVCIKGGHGTQ